MKGIRLASSNTNCNFTVGLETGVAFISQRKLASTRLPVGWFLNKL